MCPPTPLCPARPLLLLIVLLCAAPAQAAGIVAPQGAPRAYTVEDHVPRAHDTRFTLEEWTLTAQLDDGTVALVTLALSNLWFLPASVALEVSVIRPGEAAVLYGRREGTDGMTVDKAGRRVDLSPSLRMSGLPPGAMTLHVESEWHGGLILDLKLTDPWPGFVAGDGVFRVGDDPKATVQTMVVTPRAAVEGTLTIGGKASRIRGVASMEHSFYARLLSQLFVQRHAAVAWLGATTLISVAWQARDDRGGGFGGLLAACDRKGVRALSTAIDVHWDAPRKVRGCSEPGRWLVTGEGLRLGGKAGRRLQVFGLTDPMRPLTRAAVAAVVGDPIFVRGLSAVEAEVGGKRSKGAAIHRVECADEGD